MRHTVVVAINPHSRTPSAAKGSDRIQQQIRHSIVLENILFEALAFLLYTCFHHKGLLLFVVLNVLQIFMVNMRHLK